MGTTSLFGGTKVPKFDLRIDTYGGVDELNSFVGLLRDGLPLSQVRNRGFLLSIQKTLFHIGSILASEKKDLILPREVIKRIEDEIDALETGLKPVVNFVLPGGHPSVSQCHVVRSICRRVERRVTEFGEIKRMNEIMIYLNRLSDYFFVLSRKISDDFGAEEILWDGSIF